MHQGHRERVRQRFLRESLSSFAPHELMEFLLFYAIPRRDTNELAHRLMKTFGSLSSVFNAGVSELMKVEGMGRNAAILISMIPQLSQRYLSDTKGSRPFIMDSTAAGEFSLSLMCGRIYEVFFVVCMDKQRRVLYTELICEGTIDETPAYPRLIIESVLRHKAHSVILVHNHPSGGLQPSANDVNVTKRIVTVLESMDISVVDHIIVADGKFTSMSDRGLMPN